MLCRNLALVIKGGSIIWRYKKPVILNIGRYCSGTYNPKNQVFTVPNMLCGVRILLAPLTAYFIINEDVYASMESIFIAGLTDYFDGYIARKYPSQSSEFGKMLDPAADKIYICCIASSLVYSGHLPIWLASVIIIRDLFIMSSYLWVNRFDLKSKKSYSTSNQKFEPSLIGKISTLVQFVVLTLSLCRYIKESPDYRFYGVLNIICASITIFSGFHYLYRYNRIIPK